MDPAAYEELNNYLETLKKSYKDTPEGAEIIADIEARIAELILATQNNEHVVGPALIRNIIAQMGSANQINDEEPRPTHSASARNPRRLYRDAENAKLGGVCAAEQAAATSKLKDLLAGWDVLRSFGREQRFSQGADMASDQIEKPRFRLTYVKGFVSAGIGCVNIVCQMLVNVLIGVLSIQGVILQGSLMGGGNLCGSLSNGLGSMAQLLLSFSSSKPYFEKIGVNCPKCGKDIVLKMTRKGRKYYGCIDNPDCDFMVWQKPVEDRCDRCGAIMLQKGNKLACSDENCGFVKDAQKQEA